MNRFVSLLVRRLFDSGPCSARSASFRITADGKDVPKVKTLENRITLISPDNSASIMDLKNAQNLASRRDLKLVRIEDVSSKTRRPVYKLMSTSEYHEEELLKRKERQNARQNSLKGEKLLTMTTRIGDHDLQTNIKKIIKFLEKNYEVKIIISLDNPEDEKKSESMYAQIEKNSRSSGKVVQKRTKGNSLRFQILPSKEKLGRASDTPSSGDDTSKGPL